MTIKRLVAGVLPLLFVVASAGHASPLPNCKSRFRYYRVKEGLVYQGRTLIRFGIAQQVVLRASPVVLTVRVGRTAYRLAYEIADDVITRSGQNAVMVNFGIAQYLGHHWAIIAKPKMELLDGKTGYMALQRVDPHGRAIAWHLVFRAKPLARDRVLRFLQKTRKAVAPEPCQGFPSHEGLSTLLTSGTPHTCGRTLCNPGPGNLTCCGAIACCDGKDSCVSVYEH